MPHLKHLQGPGIGQVKDYTRKKLFSVGVEPPVGEVAGLMLEKNIKRLPVIDKNKHLLGIIDRAALFKYSQKGKNAYWFI